MFVSCLLSAHWPSPPDRGVTLFSTRTNDIVTLLPFCKAGAGWCALTQNSEIYDLETGVHLRCKWMLNWFLWSRWLNLAVQLVPLQHISYPVGQLNCNAAHNRMFFFSTHDWFFSSSAHFCMTERLNMPNQFSEGCRCLCAMQPWLEIQRRFFIMSIIYSFSQDWQSLSPFTVIIIFFTRFVPLIHNEQMTPLTLQLQVLIRLNMGEDVNQKHYPRSERLPGIHYYDITYMHILHTYIYNYIFISHYHIVIVAQRSFQSFFLQFSTSP